MLLFLFYRKNHIGGFAKSKEMRTFAAVFGKTLRNRFGSARSSIG